MIVPRQQGKKNRGIWARCIKSFFVLFFLVSCDSADQRALDLLSARGVEPTNEVLFGAMDQGDWELARAVIQLKGKGEASDGLGRTPMMVAAGSGAVDLMSDLIEEKVDLDRQDQTGRSALAYAVEANQLEPIMVLLAAGARVDQELATGGSLVAHALKQGRLAAVNLLLEAGANPNSQDGEGESLARIAVIENRMGIFDRLIQKGANLKEAGKVGILHLAFDLGRDEMVLQLLKMGMNVEERNERGETLVHAAVGQANLSILGELKRYGASFDEPDGEGWTPVHLAVLAPDDQILRELLSIGANPDLRSGRGGQGIRPLELAVENGLLGMARTLLRYGADPGDELYRAVGRGGLDGEALVELLLDEGASASPGRVPSLDTPLALAVRSGNYGIARRLLDAGASLELCDPCGQGLLHVAVARGDSRMVGLLLDKGADANEPFRKEVSDDFLEMVNTEGVGKWALKTAKEFFPIMLAADSGNVEMAQQLVNHGAERNRSVQVGKSRMWPLTFATRRSDTHMMQVMLGREPGKSHLWIRVKLSEQRAYIYEGDELAFTTRVSTGKRGYATRQGKFVITNKYRDWTSTIYNSSMPYFQRLSAGDFGFHVGVVPNYPASHGCIRMPHSVAKRLFEMTRVGDYVEIVP